MGKEWEPDTIFDVLGSEYAREILAYACDEAVSASELADRCGVSLPTVYRRVDALLEYGLLESETRIDDDGHHYDVYRASATHLGVDVTPDGLDVTVEHQQDIVDQFESFWRDFDRGDDE